MLDGGEESRYEGLDGVLPWRFGSGLVKPKCLRHGRAARYADEAALGHKHCAADWNGNDADAAENARSLRGERTRVTGIEDAVFGHDAIADVDAFVTDKVPGRARDELRDVLLRLVAERAMPHGTVRLPSRSAGPIPKRHDPCSPCAV